MASLYLTRVGGWFDRFRDYRIILDGAEVARIGRDANVRVPTSPGRHTLCAKIDWCASKEVTFDVADHEERRFQVGSNITVGRTFVPFWMFLYKADYLSLREVYPVGYSPYRTHNASAV